MYGLTPFGRNRFDLFNIFDDFDKNFFGSSANVCRTDIRDDGTRYVMETELPGFGKDDISLDINGSYLTISAEHRASDDKKDDSGNYIRRERSYGSYKRSFNISDVNTDDIDAEYKNGVLTVSLPKKRIEEPAPKRLEIR